MHFHSLVVPASDGMASMAMIPSLWLGAGNGMGCRTQKLFHHLVKPVV
jgi:hypothetical protein